MSRRWGAVLAFIAGFLFHPISMLENDVTVLLFVLGGPVVLYLVIELSWNRKVQRAIDEWNATTDHGEGWDPRKMQAH